MRKNSIYVIMTMIITVATALLSCNRKTVYDSYYHISLDGWDRNDTLILKVPPFAAKGIYNEEIGLRINNDFPYASVSLIIEQTIMPSNLTLSDTIKCKLYDEEGIITGQGVSCFQYNYHVRDISVEAGDSIEFKIRHYMRSDILPGITDVGIKIDGN